MTTSKSLWYLQQNEELETNMYGKVFVECRKIKRDLKDGTDTGSSSQRAA